MNTNQTPLLSPLGSPSCSAFFACDSVTGRGLTNTWFTPKEIVTTLGPFDLDPCTQTFRPHDTAARHICEDAGDALGIWAGKRRSHQTAAGCNSSAERPNPATAKMKTPCVPDVTDSPAAPLAVGCDDGLGDGLKIFPCDNLWQPENFCLVAGDRIISTHKTKDEAEAKRQHILHAPCSENLRTAGRPVSLPNFTTRPTGAKTAHDQRWVESPNATQT